MLRRVALVRTDISEELSASIIKVTRIAELGVISQKTPFFIVTAVKTSNLKTPECSEVSIFRAKQK
jgi:hypothetical protein